MDWGDLAQKVGAPLVGMILMFMLMNKQELRHKDEMKALLLAHKDEISGIRKTHEDRLQRLHDRADQMLVLVLKRINENTEAMTRLVELMGHSFRRNGEDTEE